ncbi:uncharacterized protein ColSpa_05494 [Colletotrichum spaethianum]|uniref:Uncharacterized protein n=1 Tax=Colletotrichum spaethianum TaxID=700344 RepID=A0AA37LBG2_9PEZI|nr:uncharacterized protein ColSpa_05494 [Colletotrichum spaethianum]GKT45313.1 hypothetical protein ColSpa_05494 [Colletotrichum spaethianum]
MAKDRSVKRNGPQIPDQPGIDTSILYGGKKSPEIERRPENRHGLPRDMPGKTPGGKDRHHCSRKGHTSDFRCVKKGCMKKCPDCGTWTSSLNGSRCIPCRARETRRMRDEKDDRIEQEKADAKLAKKGKPTASKSGVMAKMLLAPQPCGIRKRVGRVGERAPGRFSRGSLDSGRRSPSPSQLSDEESAGHDETATDEDEWEGITEDVDHQDYVTADEAQYQRRMEEDAALQDKIRECLLKLLS